VEVCLEHRDRLPASIHETATTDASHPHPRDTVRLLSELHIRERSSRRIDVRNQRSQTRASRPLAHTITVQMHDHRHHTKVMHITANLDPAALLALDPDRLI